MKNNDLQEHEGMSAKEQFIQILKFTAFSLSAGAIQLGLFEILYSVAHMQWWPAYLIGILASVVWNFTFNRKFTFKSASNVPIAMALVLLFYCVFVPVSVFGGNALEELGWDGTVVTLIMMLLNFVTEFLWDKFVVFRDTLSTHAEKDEQLKEEVAILREEQKNKKNEKLNKRKLNQDKEFEEYFEEDDNGVLDKGEINYSSLEEFKMDKKSEFEKRKKVDKPPRLGHINYDSVKEELELLRQMREKMK